MSFSEHDFDSEWAVEIDSTSPSTSRTGAPVALVGSTGAAMLVSLVAALLGSYWFAYVFAVLTTLGCIVSTYEDRRRLGVNYARTFSVDSWVRVMRVVASLSAIYAVVQLAIEAAK